MSSSEQAIGSINREKTEKHSSLMSTVDETTAVIANSNDRNTSNVLPAEVDMEDVESPEVKKKKKLVKYGLLLALVLVIVYVVFDYSVRENFTNHMTMS